MGERVVTCIFSSTAYGSKTSSSDSLLRIHHLALPSSHTTHQPMIPVKFRLKGGCNFELQTNKYCDKIEKNFNNREAWHHNILKRTDQSQSGRKCSQKALKPKFIDPTQNFEVTPFSHLILNIQYQRSCLRQKPALQTLGFTLAQIDFDFCQSDKGR